MTSKNNPKSIYPQNNTTNENSNNNTNKPTSSNESVKHSDVFQRGKETIIVKVDGSNPPGGGDE